MFQYSFLNAEEAGKIENSTCPYCGGPAMNDASYIEEIEGTTYAFTAYDCHNRHCQARFALLEGSLNRFGEVDETVEHAGDFVLLSGPVEAPSAE